MADALPPWARSLNYAIQLSINDARKLAKEMEEWLKELDSIGERLTTLL